MTGPNTGVHENDVVQIDPEKSVWGPVFVIVTEVRTWGIQGYFLVPENRNEPPGCAYVRVNHGDYAIIGHAEWVVQTEAPEAEPADQKAE